MLKSPWTYQEENEQKTRNVHMLVQRIGQVDSQVSLIKKDAFLVGLRTFQYLYIKHYIEMLHMLKKGLRNWVSVVLQSGRIELTELTNDLQDCCSIAGAQIDIWMNKYINNHILLHLFSIFFSFFIFFSKMLSPIVNTFLILFSAFISLSLSLSLLSLSLSHTHTHTHTHTLPLSLFILFLHHFMISFPLPFSHFSSHFPPSLSFFWFSPIFSISLSISFPPTFSLSLSLSLSLSSYRITCSHSFFLSLSFSLFSSHFPSLFFSHFSLFLPVIFSVSFTFFSLFISFSFTFSLSLSRFFPHFSLPFSLSLSFHFQSLSPILVFFISYRYLSLSLYIKKIIFPFFHPFLLNIVFQ